MTVHSIPRTGRVLFAAVAILALGVGMADARPSRGGSFGSRGDRTFSAPPPTATAPRTAAPIERSVTQPGVNAPRAAQPAAATPGGFRPGFGTGLLGGFLGAGLLGMLFGGSMFGGLGGLASFFGLILQAGLIVGAIMLAMRFFRNRSATASSRGAQPAYAGAAPNGDTPVQRSALPDVNGPVQRSALPGGLGSKIGGMLGGASRPAAPSEPTDDIGIGPADYEAFERNLKDVNTAWDKEDLAAMRAVATPEMVGYFAEELAKNSGRGLHDRVSDVKLLQGDLAEGWREGTTDYATVAMRFSSINALTERATGRVVEGDASNAEEATELWTFRREQGGSWQLSAIQQS